MDLIRHYSNHPELLSDLDRTLRTLERAAREPRVERRSVSSTGRVGRKITLHDRLSDDQIQALAKSFVLGASKAELAERYGISPKSVQRLLRQFGVRRPKGLTRWPEAP